MHHKTGVPQSTQWTRLRFSIIAQLLASPPREAGDLKRRLQELAAQTWRHPSTGEMVQFAASTIERWYYRARKQADPIRALERKVQLSAGTHPRIGLELAAAIQRLYQQHPRWSYQLHYDNLLALGLKDTSLGHVPSYATVRRFMKGSGLLRQRRKKHRGGHESQEPARHEAREMRSFEVTHVHGLWHLDFHQGSRRVVSPSGQWQFPFLLGIIDDHSRLCCHLQWYLDETAQTLVHGLSQAIQKRNLPRALLTDNGSAMLAAETEEGLARLGILHHTTLPYTPEQNAKQESFWGQVEGRLVAMLEGQEHLTLLLLNQATQAWVELDYNRRRHSELGEAPLERYLRDPNVGRPSPSSEDLRRAFRIKTRRKQRLSDGTLSAFGIRFEVPSRYRSLLQPSIRLARWDLSSIDLVDPRTGAHLAKLFPLDKIQNADRRRRTMPAPDPSADLTPAAPAGIAPHLQALMETYAATGLPPAFLPKDDSQTDDPTNLQENSL
ncbi:MAG: DDE-type integrase/transposase/recombinase [Pseudomonadota bacterium]